MLGAPKNLTQSFVALDINSSNGNVVDDYSNTIGVGLNPRGYQTSRPITTTNQMYRKSFVANPMVGRLEEDQLSISEEPRISMPFTVKRKSTASASFRRLKITIYAREISGLPRSDELL